MSSQTADLARKLRERAQQAGQTSQPKAVAVTPEQAAFARIRGLIEAQKPAIAAALPRHVTPDRLARVVLTEIRRTPKLLECKTDSLLAAVMLSAQLGLEPGPLGHVYIVPYGQEATLIIGYRGMLELARRSGQIRSIAAHVVYQNDHFRLRYGLEETLEHVPWHLREDKHCEDGGAIRGAYMVAWLKDGGHYMHYMPIADIERRRQRSKAANSGPWVTDYEAMCLKTVIRDAWRWLPISVEIAEAVERADEASIDLQDAISVEGEPARVAEPGASAAAETEAGERAPEPDPVQADSGGQGSLFEGAQGDGR